MSTLSAASKHIRPVVPITRHRRDQAAAMPLKTPTDNAAGRHSI